MPRKKKQETTEIPRNSVETGQKLLPAPKIEHTEPVTQTQRLVRLISALIFAIIGFNIADSEFFVTYPLFGLSYLAKLLITPLFALAGYFVLFELLTQVKKWMYSLIFDTVVEIVSYFWDLQSKRIQEQRRIKQKAKADSEHAKLEEVLKAAIAVDTSVLIDGRILDVVKLGFLDKTLIVAQEVIDELHALSDSKDSLKRQKGRRGLDVLKDLKKLTNIFIQKLSTNGDNKGVDKVLVIFCKERKLKLATLDFNLSKVAIVSGIKVLNINALADSIKTVLLPGEEIVIKIISPGKEKKQGIGYLNDGTMIVVEDAADLVGQEVHAKVAKVIQSQAGKMFFCKLVPSESVPAEPVSTR